MAFIDQYRTRFGVEPICRVLRERNVGIAPSTYYAYKSRPPSARTQRDAWLIEQIRRTHQGQLWGVRRFQGVGTAQPPRNTSSPVHSAAFDAPGRSTWCYSRPAQDPHHPNWRGHRLSG